MKILHRLFVYTDTIDKASRDRAAAFLSISGVIEIRNSYRRDPNILDHLVMESDDDIDEASLRRYVAEPGYHNIHLVLNEAQWLQLGIRPTLYGQCRVVGGQIITYGAWEHRRSILKHYAAQIRAIFTESTLGEWHELDHGLRVIFKINKPTTHAVFYGYSAADSDKRTARRWVRKPYPMESWQSLPWHRLPNQTPKRAGLEQELATTRFNVLTYVGQVLKNMSARINTKPTLFAAAQEYLGRDASPRNLAPSELSCAESVSTIIKEILPDFPTITGTWTLWDRLENDPRFERVSTPVAGTIIISPTGEGKRGAIGHTGIFGRDLLIMSNRSATGLWDITHNLEEWTQYYQRDRKFPIFYYQLIK